MFWLILLWIVLGFPGLLLAYILLLIISALMVDMSAEYEQESRFYRFLLNSATWCASKLIRIKLHVTGKELLPDGRFLLHGRSLEGGEAGGEHFREDVELGFRRAFERPGEALAVGLGITPDYILLIYCYHLL